ncbi:hypothetical protein LQZ21_02090 [Treponema sp. TIM-1]|uniref:TP0183 family DNA metabolism protein n=1 Tax=Treponema sp. TIM-1 TaxID=2898417 RepID=UPI00397FCED2
MRRKNFYIWLFFIIFPPLLYSQNVKPLVAIMPFTVQGIPIDEAGLIESLIKSYMGDLGTDVVFLDSAISMDTTYSSGLFRSPEYILSGSILREGENRILMLEFYKQSTGDRVLYTSVHKTLSDLALKTRSLVVSAFDIRSEPERIETEPPEQLTVNKLAGTWRGDAAIQLVRLRRNMGGTAIFTSGVQMNLTYLIENNILKVFQDSPNTERFYHPLPYQVAKRLRAEAEPMRWEFQLYEKGGLLRGKRIETRVRYEGEEILELIPGVERPVEWIKYGR